MCGDVGIFYILSLIVNTISNEDSLYIPSPVDKMYDIIQKLTGSKATGELKDVTFGTFFEGISGVYNLVASKIPTNTTTGGSNKSKTHKRKHKRKHKGKTMKLKNIMLLFIFNL